MVAGFLALALIAAGWPVVGPAHAQSAATRNVLVLNSYHQGYPWSELVVKGILEAVSEAPENIDPWFEYLDTTRFLAWEHFERLLPLYRAQYGTRHFDAVVVIDNDALDFALAHRAELFADTPIVFCGINNFDPGMIRGQTNITGVAQYDDLESTIEVALSLHPEAKRVITTTAGNTTGTILRDQAKESFSKYRDRVQIDFWHGWPLEAVLAKLGETDEQTVVIALGALIDLSGRTIPMKNVAAMLAARTRSPIYTTIETAVGVGAVGGKIASGIAQGRQAVAFVLEIMRGKAADDIPVLTRDANPYMFDFNVLERFGVSLDRLPAGSIVINQPVPAYSRYRTFTLASMAVVFVLGIFITILIFNIGRRRWAEEALRESEGRLRTLIEHSPAAIYVKDLEGRYLIANGEYRKRYGLTPKDVIGKCAHDFLNPEMAQTVTEFDELVISTQKTQTDEITGYYADGSVHSHKIVKFPIFDIRGDLSGLGCVSTDITDVKEAHKAATELRAEIAHVSRLSTMGEMAAGFAHELNQPLTAISNYAAGCLRRAETLGPVADAIRPALAEISTQAIRAGEIIRRIRGFVGKKELDRTGGKLPEIDLNETIRTAAGLIEHDAIQSGISLHVNLSPDLPRLRGDSIQIQQVVVNLVRNGIDAMSDSEPALRVLKIETGLADSRFVRVSVKDTGPGLPEGVLTKLFEPFFTTKASGMGMGLSICQSIVEQNGGNITARNRESGGAEFQFRLPIGGDTNGTNPNEEPEDLFSAANAL